MGERALLGMFWAGYLTMCGATAALPSDINSDCGKPVDRRAYPIAATFLLGAASAYVGIYRLTRPGRIETGD